MFGLRLGVYRLGIRLRAPGLGLALGTSGLSLGLDTCRLDNISVDKFITNACCLDILQIPRTNASRTTGKTLRF